MRFPDADTRSGSPLLLVVLVVLSLVLTSVYAREGANGPLHGVRSGLLLVTSPFSSAGESASRPFRSIGDLFGNLGVSRGEVATLRSQNATMRQRLAALEEAALENVRLRALLKFNDAIRGKSVAAHIIGRPSDSWEGSVLIDRGAAEGVKKGTPVAAADGLLGQVSDVGLHSSKVRLITDQSSGVAVIVQATRSPGIVRGSVDGNLTLDFVTAAKLPKVGDVLITSGMGGAYPKGLVVGDVTKVQPDASGLFPHIEVTSRVPIADIEEVLVLTGVPTAQSGGVVE